jgi:predicted RNase H-like HicB family nuclease
MRFSVLLCQEMDGTFVAECPTVPGCRVSAPTEEAAMADIRAHIKQILQERHEKHLMMMVEDREVEVHMHV